MIWKRRQEAPTSCPFNEHSEVVSAKADREEHQAKATTERVVQVLAPMFLMRDGYDERAAQMNAELEHKGFDD